MTKVFAKLELKFFWKYYYLMINRTKRDSKFFIRMSCQRLTMALNFESAVWCFDYWRQLDADNLSKIQRHLPSCGINVTSEYNNFNGYKKGCLQNAKFLQL